MLISRHNILLAIKKNGTTEPFRCQVDAEATEHVESIYYFLLITLRIFLVTFQNLLALWIILDDSAVQRLYIQCQRLVPEKEVDCPVCMQSKK